jgi:DNA replication licensing factor MCM2
MHLRNEVRNEDVDLAISVLLGSFIKSQKYVAAQQLSKKFRKHITQREDSNQLLYKLLERQMKEQVLL